MTRPNTAAAATPPSLNDPPSSACRSSAVDLSGPTSAVIDYLRLDARELCTAVKLIKLDETEEERSKFQDFSEDFDKKTKNSKFRMRNSLRTSNSFIETTGLLYFAAR